MSGRPALMEEVSYVAPPAHATSSWVYRRSAEEFCEIEGRGAGPRLARDRTRRNLSVSMASAAASLRSMCNSVRSPPECSRQRFPAGAPHVGQGTEDNCSEVRSFMRMGTDWNKTQEKAASFGTDRGKKNKARGRSGEN